MRSKSLVHGRHQSFIRTHRWVVNLLTICLAVQPLMLKAVTITIANPVENTLYYEGSTIAVDGNLYNYQTVTGEPPDDLEISTHANRVKVCLYFQASRGNSEIITMDEEWGEINQNTGTDTDYYGQLDTNLVAPGTAHDLNSYFLVSKAQFNTSVVAVSAQRTIRTLPF